MRDPEHECSIDGPVVIAWPIDNDELLYCTEQAFNSPELTNPPSSMMAMLIPSTSISLSLGVVLIPARHLKTVT